MDRGGGGSRWTSLRKKKQARLAANQEGRSDLSSSNESDLEQPVPKRTRNGSSSPERNEDEPADGNSENSSNEDQVGTDSDNQSDSDEGHGPQVVLNAVGELGANGPNHVLDEGPEIPVEADIPEDAIEGLEENAMIQEHHDGEEDSTDNSHTSSSDSEDDEESDDESSDGSQVDSGHDDSSSEESDGDIGNDGAHEDPAANAPLYENARLTKMESIVMILTLAMTFNLSGQCLVSIMDLIELHCPVINNCVKTLHNFKKFFREIGRNLLILHYFCERCYGSVPQKDSVCTTRGCPNDTNKGFFIEIPILNQLQRLFMRRGFIEQLSFRFNRQKKHNGNYEDIYDGRLYKQQMDNNGILSNIHNVSFMWYTDGIRIFKSTKFSVWPLFLVINELNFKERSKKKNIILAGLWFGQHKPKPNLFLKPFRNFFETFKTNGFQFNVPGGLPITVKGLLLCGTCDLQAKGIFLRSKLSNGYFGCNKCISAGERVPAGGTTVHVHRYIRPQNIQLRDNNLVPAQARQKIFGYKGLSLLHVFMPSMIKGTGIDIMHQVFLGIAKLLTTLWFSPRFADQPFSCVRMVPTVNERLKSLKPPSFVQRLTRSLDELKLWKAKEFKVWFFYYSCIVMSGLLDNVYLHHHLKLVSAISLLCQESIFPEQVDAADALLHEYVQDFQALYSLRFMGMNVHLLLHLAETVTDLGNLWVYSCFFMEDLNGQIVRLIHGPNQPGLQICSSASLFLSLKTKIDSLAPLSLAKSYCDNLYRVNMNYRVAKRINDKTLILGKAAFNFNVSEAIKQLVRDYLQVLGGHFQYFFLIRKSGVLYHSERRPQSVKRCSSYVSFSHNNGTLLGNVKDFVRFSDCACPGICLCEPGHYLFVAQVYERIPWFAHEVQNVRIAHLSAVAPTNNFIVAPITSIQSLCFYMKVEETEYLSIPVNSLEYE